MRDLPRERGLAVACSWGSACWGFLPLPPARGISRPRCSGRRTGASESRRLRPANFMPRAILGTATRCSATMKCGTCSPRRLRGFNRYSRPGSTWTTARPLRQG
jgi:hypothetical protein